MNGRNNKSYEVLIPKYEFKEENGTVCRSLGEESLSIVVDGSSEPDAAFNALRNVNIEKLTKEGYNFHDMKVTELLSGRGMRVSITGIGRLSA